MKWLTDTIPTIIRKALLMLLQLMTRKYTSILYLFLSSGVVNNISLRC